MSVARVDEQPPDVPVARVRAHPRSLTIAANDDGPGAALARRRWLRWFGSESFVYPDWIERPVTRADCIDMPRPCAFVSCKFHLYLDVNPQTGSLTINFPDLEPGDLAVTCALDVADEGGKTLDEVARALNLTRERIRQYEVVVLRKIKHATNADLGIPPERDSVVGRAWKQGRPGAD